MTKQYTYCNKTPFISIEHYNLEKNVVNIIPEEVARKYNVIALEERKCGLSTILVVATSNPKLEHLTLALEKLSGSIIRELEVDHFELLKVLDIAYKGEIK